MLTTFIMPTMQPVPIPTRNLPRWKSLWVWISKPRQWRIVKDWVFTLPEGEIILIPNGFIFDGASIPRILWWLVSPTGILLIPGLIHDFGYKYRYLPEASGLKNHLQGAARKVWDKLFRDIAIQVNGFKIINYGAWLSLVLFGHFAWRNHRKNDG